MTTGLRPFFILHSQFSIFTSGILYRTDNHRLGGWAAAAAGGLIGHGDGLAALGLLFQVEYAVPLLIHIEHPGARRLILALDAPELVGAAWWQCRQLDHQHDLALWRPHDSSMAVAALQAGDDTLSRFRRCLRSNYFA